MSETKKQLVIIGFENYEKGSDYGYSVYYQALLDLGLINPTANEKKGYIQKAKDLLLKEYSQKVGYKWTQKFFDERTKELQAVNLSDLKTLPDYLVSESKKMIVRDFYQTLNLYELKNFLK